MSHSDPRASTGCDPVLSLTLERYDYARVGDHVAVMQVLARVPAGQPVPVAAELTVYAAGDQPTRYPTRACRAEHRLLAGGAVQTLWRALFTVPVAAVERAGTLYELSGGAERTDAVILPVPELRHPGPTALALIPAEELARPVGANLRQVVAVATAVAITATSSPAMAFAASSTPMHPPGTRARITDRVRIAQDQLQQRKLEGLAHGHAGGATSRPAANDPSMEVPVGSSGGVGAGTSTLNPAAPTSATPATPATPSTPATPATPSTPANPTPANPTATNPATPPNSTPTTPAAPANSTPTPPTNSTPTTPAPATPARPKPSHPKPPVRDAAPRVRHTHTETRSHHPGQTVTRRGTTPGGAPVLGGLSDRPPTTLGSGASTTGAPTLTPNPPGFSGPKSWTGTVTEDPALQGALGNLSNLLANGDSPPAFLIPVYMEASRRYHIPWEVLAAINAVESDYGRNLNTSSAGAIGWMQFEPSTWKRWGLAADGHSVPNPYDPRDAIFSAARYLAAAGAASDLWGAIYAYNHASWYVDMVMTRAKAIAANVRPERRSVRRGVVSVFFTTGQRRHPVARFKGGVLSHYVRLVAAANMVSAANFPYVWGGGHEQPARFTAFDCSGSVSYVIQQAGYKVPTTVSGNIRSWGFPRGPGRVTIFYNPTHTFMRIGNRYFGTSGFARPSGGGAGWFSTNRLPAGYLAQFSEVHVPVLGANSFRPHKRLRLHGGTSIKKFSSTQPQLLSQLSPSPAFSAPHGFHL